MTITSRDVRVVRSIDSRERRGLQNSRGPIVCVGKTLGLCLFFVFSRGNEGSIFEKRSKEAYNEHIFV